ncbi:MAG TPA: extracellular solute-binding protein [Chloroflexota bacterium]
MRVISRRRVLGLALAAWPALAGCRVDPYEVAGAPRLAPTAPAGRELLLWHADAGPGERVFARELGPRFAEERNGLVLTALAHGDPDDLLRRAGQAEAGGVGPDVIQVPGEWMTEAAEGKLVRPLLDDEAARLLAPDVWAPKLTEAARYQGSWYGVPAAGWFRQPFFNDELLRNAGLVQTGRTTPPSTWAEYADVCKRVAAPEDRWGAALPSQRGDEELFLHVYQHVHAAGGELPRPRAGRIGLDTPQLRSALEFLLDLVRSRGALPLDRPPFPVAELGRAGLWWASSQWSRTQAAVGSTLRLGAALVPSAAPGGGRGVILRSRHWCLGRHGASRDDGLDLLRFLAGEDVSHAYCASLWLPPAKPNNAEKPPYRPAAGTPTPFATLWPAILEQLGQPDNLPLVTYPVYRALAGRIAGEFVLALTGKKPIATALSEGEAGANELLRQGQLGVSFRFS